MAIIIIHRQEAEYEKIWGKETINIEKEIIKQLVGFRGSKASVFGSKNSNHEGKELISELIEQLVYFGSW